MTRRDSPTPQLTTREMRWLLAIASGLVLAIGTPLVVVPTKTDTFFSWTVNPPITAAFLGGAYCASFLLEYLSSGKRAWAEARSAIPAVLTFTALTLVVTLVHVDKFHFGSESSVLTQAITWAWLLVYAVVPVIMLTLLVIQLRAPGKEPPRRDKLPLWPRVFLVVQAVIALPVGAALLIAPTTVAPEVWPWTLSALTGRAVGAWLIGLGVSTAQSAWENDLVRLGPAMASYSVFGALQLLAVGRFAVSDHPITGAAVLNWGGPRPWVFLVFALALTGVGAWGWRAAGRADRRRRAPAAAYPRSRRSNLTRPVIFDIANDALDHEDSEGGNFEQDEAFVAGLRAQFGL